MVDQRKQQATNIGSDEVIYVLVIDGINWAQRYSLLYDVCMCIYCTQSDLCGLILY